MCCRCCSERQRKIWVFTIGGILTVTGVVLIVGWPGWSDKLIERNLPLAPGSAVYNKWVTTPLPVYMNIYLYNWTNPEDVNNPQVKPHFEELGPYSFRDFKVKKDLEWNRINNTVSYYSHHTWWFEPDRSNGTLEDLITLPHLASVMASKNSRHLHPIIRKIFNFAINREGGKLTQTELAGDMIFSGYYDHLIDFGVRLHSPYVPIDTNQFSWFLERNDSKEAEGRFTIQTGRGDLSQMGNLKLWNNAEFTGHYEGECGRVNGTSGEVWAPGIKWNDPVSINYFDAGRYLNIFPIKNVTYRGIEAWRYETTNRTFDNGNIVADTKCFCIKGRECPKNGVTDFSPIAYQSPTYLSHRHFYKADPMYRENTSVFNPDPEKHGFHVVLEPKWGIPLDIKGQVLLSLLVERDEQIDIFRDIAYNFYCPLLDLQFEYVANDEILRLSKLLLNLPKIGQYIGIALLVIGVVMISVGIFLTSTHRWLSKSYSKEDNLSSSKQKE